MLRTLLLGDTGPDVPAEVDTSGTAAPDGTIPYESTSCETGRASSSCYEELTLSVPSVATSISAVAKGCRSGCKARTVQPWPVWCHSPHAFSLAQHHGRRALGSIVRGYAAWHGAGSNTLRHPLSSSILEADMVGTLDAWCMTICHQVAFNLPSATMSNRHEPLARWFTVVSLNAGVPALAYPLATVPGQHVAGCISLRMAQD